jgi:hypothetical protein
MDCVFHVYMQQEDKAMVMTLYNDSSKTTLTKHHDINNNNIYDNSETINTHNKA